MPARKPEIWEWIEANRNKHRCECGCGGFVEPNLRRYYHARNGPWFINLHQNRGAFHPNYKGGQVMAKGYVWIWMPPGSHPRLTPRGYVKRCWLVIEKVLGRHLRPEDVVHHKNGVKTDDRPENLEVTDRVDHGKEHNSGAGNPAYRNDISAADVGALRASGMCRQAIARKLKCSPTCVKLRLQLLDDGT